MKKLRNHFHYDSEKSRSSDHILNKRPIMDLFQTILQINKFQKPFDSWTYMFLQRTMEAFTIILSVTQLFYIAAIHGAASVAPRRWNDGPFHAYWRCISWKDWIGWCLLHIVVLFFLWSLFCVVYSSVIFHATSANK